MLLSFNKKIILASASPRRQKMLQEIFGEVQSVVPVFIEEKLPSEGPNEYVIRNSLGKARSVFSNLENHMRSDCLIIAADTVVVMDDDILEKPKDYADAFRMLAQLSGRQHEVLTGFSLLSSETGEFSDIVSTKVNFRSLSSELISAYIKSGEPFDKAGGYGIQGLGGYLVDSIEGSYSNVVGLPVSQLLNALGKLT